MYDLYSYTYENILLCNSYHKKVFQDQYSWILSLVKDLFWFGFFHNLNIDLISSLLIQH